MIQTNTIKHPELKEQLDQFVQALKQQTGENLRSVVLYGGYAKNDFTYGKSNVNVLMIFDSVDLQVLDTISVIIQKAMGDFRLSPFILTTSEIEPSSDVFAVKLFDIQKHHVLLYGSDYLGKLNFDRKNLQFISGQEVRNQLARMKLFYMQHFNEPEVLLKKVQSGTTTLLVNANVLLFLKHGIYLSTRKEITEYLLKEKEMDEAALNTLLELKNNGSAATIEQIKSGYDLLMIEFKQLIKAFKHL